MGKRCESCGSVIKLTHKETLNKMKLKMLKIAARHVIETKVNDFSLKELDDNVSNYANWQKLRYHGLVHYVTKNGSRQRGRWLITRNGWAFLRGEISLPKYVLVKNNHIESRSDRLITVREVYYGAEEIQTTFEYFDDDGKPVGFRPTIKQSNNMQMSFV